MDNSIGIADLAALVTVAGVTIYVLGLIGLAIPISRRFNVDLSAAWYAVSLLPRTIVAGQGVRIWVQWPLFLTALWLLVTWLQPGALLGDLLGSAPNSGDELVVTAVVIFPMSAGFAIALVRERWADEARWRRVAFYILVMTIGTTVVWAVIVLRADLPLIYKIPLLFAGTFLIGVPRAIVADSPLPQVEITKQVGTTMESSSSLTEVAGHLLAHSDGFWHIFDKNNDLLSIPDDQVSSVRIVSKTDTPHIRESRRERILRFLGLKAK